MARVQFPSVAPSGDPGAAVRGRRAAL